MLTYADSPACLEWRPPAYLLPSLLVLLPLFRVCALLRALAAQDLKAWMIKRGLSQQTASGCITADNLLSAWRSMGKGVEFGELEHLCEQSWAADAVMRLKHFYLHTNDDTKSLLFNAEVCLPETVALDEVDFLLITQPALEGDGNKLLELLRRARLPSGVMLSSKVLVFRDRAHMLLFLEAYQGPPHTEAEVERAMAACADSNAAQAEKQRDRRMEDIMMEMQARIMGWDESLRTMLDKEMEKEKEIERERETERKRAQERERERERERPRENELIYYGDIGKWAEHSDAVGTCFLKGREGNNS